MSSDTTQPDAEAAAADLVDPTEEQLDNPGYEIFVAVLSLLSIFNIVGIALAKDQAIQFVLGTMNLLLSGILFIDFLQRFIKAPRRGVSGWHYFFREFGWADLAASIPVAQLKIFRVFRLWKAYRLFKRYGVKHLWRTLLDDRAGSALWLLLIIATFVLQFGSVWMLRIEQYAPGANITTASDAVWYTIVTISTVGYGDHYPVTNPGRVLGTIVIVLGVGIFGTLTGFLANAFIAPRKKTAEEVAAEEAEEAEEDAEHAAEVARDVDLHDKVESLQAMLVDQQQAIARLEDLLRQR